jgi:hypothetical protein
VANQPELGNVVFGDLNIMYLVINIIAQKNCVNKLAKINVVSLFYKWGLAWRNRK